MPWAVALPPRSCQTTHAAATEGIGPTDFTRSPSCRGSCLPPQRDRCIHPQS